MGGKSSQPQKKPNERPREEVKASEAEAEEVKPFEDDYIEDGSAPSSLLVLVDSGNKRIVFLDPRSKKPVDTLDLGDGKWTGVCAHRPDPSTDDAQLAVSDCESHTVKVFDMKSKKLIRTIGLGGSGFAPGQLNFPSFLCMHYPTGTAPVLVVSNAAHRVDLFDMETGHHIRSIGKHPDASIQLKYPGAVAVWYPQLESASNAQLIVSNAHSHRIQFFQLSDGEYVRSIGQQGDLLQLPMALAIHVPPGGGDEDALLVTIGWENSRIHVFALVSGEYLRSIGRGAGSYVDTLSPYSACGVAFYRPEGLGFDELATEIIISDKSKDRLLVFNLYSGKYIRSIGGGKTKLFSGPWCMSILSVVMEEEYILK